MMEDRRIYSNPLDVAGAIAVLYTLGFLGTVVLLFFVQIPPENKEAILQILGLMSAIEMAIIGAFFGTSKNAEAMQRASAERIAKTEAAVQDIARSAPATSVAAIAATVAAEAAKVAAPPPIPVVPTQPTNGVAP